MTSENVKLFGGSNRFPWAVEPTTFSSELSVTVREWPESLWEVVMGESPSKTAASATGTITEALVNKNGTSVLDATTGIASATIKSGSEADLKTTKYVVKAASTTTVDVYAYNDVDNELGTAFTFQDDLLKITASPLTISMGAAVEVPGTGIELTGGSGTIGMTTDDTAEYATAPIHDGYTSVDIGTSTQKFPNVGIYISGQKTSDDKRIVILELYKCVPTGGLTIPFGEKAFHEGELTFDATYDSAKNAVGRIYMLNSTS